jgi:N-acetylneuraminate synthase
MNSVTIIVDLCINHNADLSLAKRMIRVAKKCGASMVKFQKRDFTTYSDRMYDSPLFGRVSYKEHKRRLEFNKTQYDSIDKLCKNIEMPWFAAAFDINSLLFIDDYEPRYHKIPSPKVTDLEFVQEVAKLGKHTIMSTGMCSEKELDVAINSFLKINSSLYLMHTTSIYPTPLEKVNLNYMRSLYKKYGLPTGYSSHDTTVPICVAAVAMGAKMIEKHFTLDRAMKGTDHSASLEPRGLETLVRHVRAVEKSFGSYNKQFYEEEKEVREKVKQN